ncbi:MAG: hypothetical protein WCL02_00795 [bacterium]
MAAKRSILPPTVAASIPPNAAPAARLPIPHEKAVTAILMRICSLIDFHFCMPASEDHHSCPTPFISLYTLNN